MTHFELNISPIAQFYKEHLYIVPSRCQIFKMLPYSNTTPQLQLIPKWSVYLHSCIVLSAFIEEIFEGSKGN